MLCLLLIGSAVPEPLLPPDSLLLESTVKMTLILPRGSGALRLSNSSARCILLSLLITTWIWQTTLFQLLLPPSQLIPAFPSPRSPLLPFFLLPHSVRNDTRDQSWGPDDRTGRETRDRLRWLLPLSIGATVSLTERQIATTTVSQTTCRTVLQAVRPTTMLILLSTRGMQMTLQTRLLLAPFSSRVQANWLLLCLQHQLLVMPSLLPPNECAMVFFQTICRSFRKMTPRLNNETSLRPLSGFLPTVLLRNRRLLRSYNLIAHSELVNHHNRGSRLIPFLKLKRPAELPPLSILQSLLANGKVEPGAR